MLLHGRMMTNEGPCWQQQWTTTSFQQMILSCVTYDSQRQQITNKSICVIAAMNQRLAQINSALKSPPNRLSLIRKRTQLHTQQLKDLLFSPGAFNRHIQPIFQYFENSKHIYSQHNLQGHSLQQQRKEAARMSLNNLKKFKVDIKKQPEALPFVRYATGCFDLSTNTKASVHAMLYTNSLLIYGSNQKHQEYFDRATAAQDLGCFGLTEFHHGSYSKGIQTTATYHHARKAFLLSTHGTKGMKFWIGGAAQTATISVIWAQLIVNGVSEGPHPFVVRLRCPKTHKVLPGITIGDCGPKNGGNGIDNGFIIVQDLIVPVQNLLGKFGWIDGEGKYESVTEDKDRRFGLFMTALSSGRGIISLGCNAFAMNALAIALRYACSRKQFENNAKDDQITIIDYPITQVRIIPNLANIILQIAAGTVLSLAYYQKDKVYLTDPLYAAELHALAAAVKSKYTREVAKTVGECRTILGGHGYSALSGFSKLYHSSDVNTTWEGDNNVLLQQTTKFILKSIGNKQKTKILDLSFVSSQEKLNFQSIQQDLRNAAHLESMIKDLLRIKYKIAKSKVGKLEKIYNKEEADYNLHPQAGNSLSLTYADLFTFTIATTKIHQAKNLHVKVFLQKCLFLWGFVILEKERYGTHDLRKALQSQIIALSQQLVDPSVIVIDALSPSSFVMSSPFGDFNGQGFKEYLNILYTKEGAFLRSHYYQTLRNTVTTNE